MAKTVAITGATGFVGRHTVAVLAAAGWQVRVLARSEPAHALWRGITPEVVLGSLGDRAALERLVQGADAVLHLAGAIKARDDAEFLRVNRDGTLALALAAQKFAPKAHFLHISSLAAREPQLSGYSASKRAGEDAVLATLGTRASVLRPPAVYGPGDRETLVFFQLARLPWVPLLGRDSARTAVIHVEDLARVVTAQLSALPTGVVHSLADSQPEGYSWREILMAAAVAVGNPKPKFVQIPQGLLWGLGHSAGVVAKLAGQAAMFNAGKLRELLHQDWSVARDSQLPSPSPCYSLAEGFNSTAAWYRSSGWLPANPATDSH